MEALLLIGISYIGMQLNEKNKYKKNKSINIYHNNNINEFNKKFKKKADKKIKQSKNSKFTNVIPQDYNSNNEYLKQFEIQRADKIGVPNPSNQIYKKGIDKSLQRDLEFKEGFTLFDDSNMTYNVVKDSKLFHNNMTPATSRREIIQPNYSVYENKLANMTGWSKDFKHKKETEPFFDPSVSFTDINGVKMRTDELKGRYLPSFKNNKGNLPFKNNVKVKPGVDGKTQTGRYNTYRIMPRKTNALRGDNNPKISYKSVTNETIKKGGYRPSNPNITKYKIKGFKTTTCDDLQPTYSNVEKPKLTGIIQKPNTNRSISKEYKGHASFYNQKNAQHGEIQKSDKITYFADTQSRNVSNIEYKPIMQNSKSFSNIPNQRSDTTTQHPSSGPYVGSSKIYTVNPNDIPLTTLREMMIYGDNNIGITNTNNKTYTFSKDNILPTTIKDTLLHEQFGPQIHQIAGGTGHSYNPADIARKTIKETTLENNHSGMVSLDSGGYIYNKDEILKPTIRQTTTFAKNPHNLKGPDMGYTKNQNEKARPTIRQTTAFSKNPYNLTGQDVGYAKNPNEKARPTIRQTTAFSKNPYNLTGQDVGYAKNPNEKARPTIRQTTAFSKNPYNLTGQDVGYAKILNDCARSTIRQTTSHNKFSTGVSGQEFTYSKNPNDYAKSTIRQTTSHNYTGYGVGGQEHTYSKNPHDYAKSTIRQTTTYAKEPHNLTGRERVYIKNPNEKARPTIRQTTSHNYTGYGVGGQEHTYAKNPIDIAKTTIKQTTIHNKISSGPSGVEHTYSKNPNDTARKTIKHSTLFCTPGGRTKVSVDKSYSKTIGDKARPTIKETTHLLNRIGPLEGENRKAKLFDDVKNIETNEKREIIAKNRFPTMKGQVVGPAASSVKMRLKIPTEINRLHAPSRPSVNPVICDIDKIYTRNKNKLKTTNYRINNNFINTLKDNPYVNDMVHRKINTESYATS